MVLVQGTSVVHGFTHCPVVVLKTQSNCADVVAKKENKVTAQKINLFIIFFDFKN